MSTVSIVPGCGVRGSDQCPEEMDDDYISDGGEDDLSPEDYGAHFITFCRLCGLNMY